MEVKKILSKLENRIENYLTEQKKYEIGTPLYEFYGVKITELRCCILDICDWVCDEILGEGEE